LQTWCHRTTDERNQSARHYTFLDFGSRRVACRLPSFAYACRVANNRRLPKSGSTGVIRCVALTGSGSPKRLVLVQAFTMEVGSGPRPHPCATPSATEPARAASRGQQDVRPCTAAASFCPANSTGQVTFPDRGLGMAWECAGERRWGHGQHPPEVP
jgi:hypothetical protein